MDRRALLVAGLVGVALFAVALASYLAGPGLADAAVAGAVGAGPAWLRPLATGFAVAGSAPVGFVLAVAACALLAWRRRWPDAFRVGLVWLASEATAFTLKLAFARPRPEGALADGFSFPSGHATRAAALAVLAAWLLLREPRPLRRAGALVAVGAAWAVLQAFGRVAMGVHYASDVVGGLGLGLAVAGAGLAALTMAPAAAAGRARP